VFESDRYISDLTLKLKDLNKPFAQTLAFFMDFHVAANGRAGGRRLQQTAKRMPSGPQGRKEARLLANLSARRLLPE
jgi:hypothetical protein